jgi:hypothetical protein
MARPRPIIGWFLPVGAVTSLQVNDGYAALKEGSLNRVVVTWF